MQSESMDILKRKKEREFFTILNAVLFPEDIWLENTSWL